MCGSGRPTVRWLLFDTNAARGRNDLGFEQRVLVAFRELCGELALVGVLVGTQIGRVHAERIAREQVTGYRVVTDLAEARRASDGRSARRRSRSARARAPSSRGSIPGSGAASRRVSGVSGSAEARASRAILRALVTTSERARTAASAGLFVLAIALLTTRGLDTGDAAVHLDTAIALATRGDATLSIDPGSLWVPSRPLAGGLFYQSDDGLRSASAPGLALVAVPLVAVASTVSRREPPRFDPLFEGGDPRVVIRPLQHDARVIAFALIGPLSAALAVMFLVLAASELGLSRAAITAMIASLALGSPLFAYAGTPWTQLPTAAALSLVLHRLCAREARSSARVGSLGVAGALAILVRPDHAVFVVIAIAVLYRIERGWKRSPSRAMARVLVPVALAFVALAIWGMPASGGGWSLREVPRGLAGLAISPRTGLVVYAPFVALVPLGLMRLRERASSIALLVIGWLAAALIGYSGWFDWGASLAYGPRFLVPILPALALAFGVAFDALGVRGRVLAWALVALGFAIELPGALLVHARIAESDRLLDPAFVTAWRSLVSGRALTTLGVDCASAYVPAYSALAFVAAAAGLALTSRFRPRADR